MIINGCTHSFVYFFSMKKKSLYKVYNLSLKTFAVLQFNESKKITRPIEFEFIGYSAYQCHYIVLLQ